MVCAGGVVCVETETEAEQDSGSKATEYFGNGAEINVIVRLTGREPDFVHGDGAIVSLMEIFRAGKEALTSDGRSAVCGDELGGVYGDC